MKIQITPKGEVDFEAPIQMTEEQREKLISFFEKRFEDIVVKEVSEKSRSPPSSGERKEWTLDDYSLLLGPKDNKEIAENMERSEMSIRMKRGSFVPNFMSWARKKGYTQTKDKSVIKEYLEEKNE